MPNKTFNSDMFYNATFCDSLRSAFHKNSRCKTRRLTGRYVSRSIKTLMSITTPIILIIFAGFLFGFWKKMNLHLRYVMAVSWVIVSLLSYPSWNFSRQREKVDPHFFEGRCSEAILYAHDGLKYNYGQISNTIIGISYGFTPKYFFLSIIGICESRQGKHEKSIATLSKVLEYAKSNKYDMEHINKTKELLRKAKLKLGEG